MNPHLKWFMSDTCRDTLGHSDITAVWFTEPAFGTVPGITIIIIPVL